MTVRRPLIRFATVLITTALLVAVQAVTGGGAEADSASPAAPAGALRSLTATLAATRGNPSAAITLGLRS